MNSPDFKYLMIKLLKPSILFLLGSLFFFSKGDVLAQTYGLKFNGLNESQDKRTELDLSHGGYLNFQNDFEISFDYKASRLRPDSNTGLFGYIVRIINKDDKNVDLLSSIKPGMLENGLDFSLVVGSKGSIVQAKYPEDPLDVWMRLKIKIDLAKDKLIFYTPDAFYVQENIGFNKIDDIKIVFGVNDFGQFKTSDVPTMAIKDVRISEQGRLRYHWPLDEKEGDAPVDRLTGKKAHIKNPTWLNLDHQIWKSQYDYEFDSEVMFAANEEKGEFYMIGTKELAVFSGANNSVTKHKYQNAPSFVNKEYRAIYNSIDDKIYCYLVDGDTYYTLDLQTFVWTSVDSDIKTINSYYRHHNRYFSAVDNSIYMFGGYGRHNYNNEIRKIDVASKNYINLATNDSVFLPRYLAGLGALNDTVYILGGYGSKTGNQLINPQSYYDLIGYSVKNKTLFRKFEIPHVVDDMCVANSMWIDEHTRDYYALIFEKSKYDGYLRLIKGNLDISEVELVGEKFPFQFLDVRSTAELLYLPTEKKLFAYTSYRTEEGPVQSKIYSINYPPNKYVEPVVEIEEEKDQTLFYVLLFCGIAFGFGAGFLMKKKKRKKVESVVPGDTDVAKSTTDSDHREEIANSKNELNYHLIFFGGFQVIGKNQEDITNNFTPLLKELFLLIWLHTFKNNKGISTEKITEILWYDKSEKSAQNNRAVNLAKLRALLSEIGDFKISKKTGYWKTVFDEDEIKSDYVDFLNLTSSRESLTKEKIYKVIEITKKGPFLRNVQYQWLDDFKAKVSNDTIDTLIHFANLCDIKKEADFIIHLADSIFIFDVTNEDAMALKCRAQYIMGKHSHAKATYKKFSEEYLEMYGEKYEQSFIEVIKTES